MTRLTARLARLRDAEPVRMYAALLAAPLSAALVAEGIVSEDAASWLVLGLALLLGIPAVELTRARVTPVAKLTRAAAVAAAAKDAGPDAVRAALDDVTARLQAATEYVGRHRKD